jgi:hypothetical protein
VNNIAEEDKPGQRKSQIGTKTTGPLYMQGTNPSEPVTISVLFSGSCEINEAIIYNEKKRQA